MKIKLVVVPQEYRRYMNKRVAARYPGVLSLRLIRYLLLNLTRQS